jgi:hypothetical protein
MANPIDAINDKCWDLLDAVHLGDFFEDHNIPPILFPLMIVLLVLAIYLLLTPSAAPGPECGDGVCSPDETCPGDCGAEEETFTLIVRLEGSVEDAVEVSIYSPSDDLIATKKEASSAFEFPKFKRQEVKLRTMCPNGKSRSYPQRTVSKGENTIILDLPEGCFDDIQPPDENEEPVFAYGNVEVSVRDGSTGGMVDATVLIVGVPDGITEARLQTINGQASGSVAAGRYYYIAANADGYESYSGRDESFYLTGGYTESRAIFMEQLESGVGQGSVMVCAKSGSEPLERGTISLNGLGNIEISRTTLTPEDKGCTMFTVESGLSVKAAVVIPPPGCVPTGFSREVMVDAGLGRIDLDVRCAETAYLKVIVHDTQRRVLTQNVTVTLRADGEQVVGTAPDGSLSMGSGGYTEEVTIPAGVPVMARVTGVPVGFMDTDSRAVNFTAGSHGVIDVILPESISGLFTFNGATIVYTPSAPGSRVRIYVQEITYRDDIVLTDENSDVEVIINNAEYPAEYEPVE